jgi:hypothetical protein
MFKKYILKTIKSGVVVHSYNLNIWEAEAGGLQRSKLAWAPDHTVWANLVRPSQKQDQSKNKIKKGVWGCSSVVEAH